MSSAMAVAGTTGIVQQSRMEFTIEQEKLIRDMYGNGAGETEFRVFMEICRARRLNPLLRQIYFVSRNEWQGEGAPPKKVWTVQVGIDGFRAIAERTGQYDGQDEPEFIYADDADRKVPICAKVKVYRKGIPRPFVGVAFYSEYVQRGKGNNPNKMWATMPHNQLAKCSEALAFRKAFPEDLSGLYTPDEMAQADNPIACDAETGEVVEEQPRCQMRKASVVREQSTSVSPSHPDAVSSVGNADAGLVDDLLLRIINASDLGEVYAAMRDAGALVPAQMERVLVDGLKRLLEFADRPKIVDTIYEAAREYVSAGQIRPGTAKTVLKPAIDKRKAELQSIAAA